MKEMQERLGADPELAEAYAAAHEAYLAARTAIGEVPEIAGISAGGMPDRVKCLHVLAGQALAQGRGVNPLGDEVLDLLGDWWASGPASPPAGPAAAMTRVAAIDCGTNTIKLMVADLPERPVLEREVRMVRLGQDVDRTGRLADEALARTFAAVDEYAAHDRARTPSSGSASAPPPPPATPATARSSPPASASGSASTSRSSPGTRRPGCPSTGPCATCADPARAGAWSSTSAAARPS